MNWIYVDLKKDGRLYDCKTGEIAVNAPAFDSFAAAEKWLEDNDVRVSIQNSELPIYVVTDIEKNIITENLPKQFY